MVFGGLFAGYVAYRTAYPAAFAEGSRRLNVLIGGVNTVVLLTSSLTMAMAVHAAQTGRRRGLVGYLIVTALLGAAFMALKAVEYWLDYRENLVPGLAFQAGECPNLRADPKQGQFVLRFSYFLTSLPPF